MQTIQFRAMGCRMMAALASDSPKAADILADVPHWFADWESVLSRFRDDSELSRLNHGIGQPVTVSQVLWDVLKASLQAARHSHGLVAPTLLGALETAGYTQSFELLGADGSQMAVEEPTHTDWQAIELNSRTHSVMLPAGMRLDFGGIAKGWAADQALKHLTLYGPALVDAGGDIAAGEPPPDQPGWPVGITDPFHKADSLGLLKLTHVGVATSGRDYRKWLKYGQWQHHIIDPRTQRPSETDVLSATIVAPTAREAEMAAKTVLILGSAEGLDWLEEQTEFGGLIVRDDESLIYSQRLNDYLWRTT